MVSELVKPAHLDRRAVVYVRQSTPHQVITNQESLKLQYALSQRARDLGWREADIDVIDSDLGQSGATAAHRKGPAPHLDSGVETGFPKRSCSNITSCSSAACTVPATALRRRAGCLPRPSDPAGGRHRDAAS